MAMFVSNFSFLGLVMINYESGKRRRYNIVPYILKIIVHFLYIVGFLKYFLF
jgi:hypothetical protein